MWCGSFLKGEGDLHRGWMIEKNRFASNQGRILLMLLFVTYLLDSFFRRTPSALTHVLMPEFGLSYTAAGLVMSIYMLPYALMQVQAASSPTAGGRGVRCCSSSPSH